MLSGNIKHTAETLRARRNRGGDSSLCPRLSPRSKDGTAEAGSLYGRFSGSRLPSKSAGLFASPRFLHALGVSAVSLILIRARHFSGRISASPERVG